MTRWQESPAQLGQDDIASLDGNPVSNAYHESGRKETVQAQAESHSTERMVCVP